VQFRIPASTPGGLTLYSCTEEVKLLTSRRLCVLHRKLAVKFPALRTLTDALAAEAAAGTPCAQRPGADAEHRGKFPRLEPGLRPAGRQRDQLAHISSKLLDLCDKQRKLPLGELAGSGHSRKGLRCSPVQAPPFW